MLYVREDVLDKAVFMENRKMPEHECVQRFSKANGESKSAHPYETGFQILDTEKATQIPNSKQDQSPRAKCYARMADPQQLHSLGNAISIDQEEEIWAELERRIHTP